MNEKQTEIKAALQDELCPRLASNIADELHAHVYDILAGANVDVSDDTVDLICCRLCNAMNDWLNGAESESVSDVWGYVLEGID